jgi:hypothetical protein
MTPSINRGESIHDPGPIVRGMFQDMGWTLDGGSPTATPTRTPTATPTQLSLPLPTIATGWSRSYIPDGLKSSSP